jgi:hypothetical protein
MRAAVAGVVGVVYIAAVVGKARRQRAFVDYLQPVFRRCAPAAARGAMIWEVVMALTFIAAAIGMPTKRESGLASTAFLGAASAVYAVLIAAGHSTGCACFGDVPRLERGVTDAIKPAVVAARNAFLVLASLTLAGVDVLLAAGVAVVVPALFAAALFVSTVNERRRIGHYDHPLVRQYTFQMGRLQAQMWWLDGQPKPLLAHRASTYAAPPGEDSDNRSSK